MIDTMDPAKPPAEPLTLRISSALLEIQNNDPKRAPRFVLWTVCSLFVLLVLWSIFGKLDIVAVAEGKLVPQTYTKIVQPLETGIVKEILVKEGDAVKAGQVLMRLDATLLTAEGRSVGNELALRQLQVERIDAELSGESFTPSKDYSANLIAQARAQFDDDRAAFQDAIDEATANRAKAQADIASAEESLRMLEKTTPSLDQTARSYESLAAQGLVPAIQAQEKRRDAIEKSQAMKSQESTIRALAQTMESTQQKLEQIHTSYRSKLQAERADATSQVQKLTQESVKQVYRGDRLELRAPQDGIVKDVATTTVGAVVQPGTVLLTVVPTQDALLAEVQIKNEDVGFVEVGQPVRIKLAAFPFQKYGIWEGRVINVGAEASDRRKSEDSASHDNPGLQSATGYKALVEINRSASTAPRFPLEFRAGMSIVGEIVQGQRSVLEFLLSPVKKIANEAGEER